MENQTITTRAEKPNSYEFGKAGNRFKLFFETAEELKKMMDDLDKFKLGGEEVIV